MSILLDALRKSEKNQQSYEVPSIHDSDQSDMGFEPLQTVPLALLLVVALFLSGWFVWHQYQLPAGSYQLPVTLKPGKARAVTTPVAVQPTATVKATESKPSLTVADHSASRPRTPVESYQQAIRNTSRTQTNELGLPKPTAREKVSTKPVMNEGGVPAHHEPAPISYWELPDVIRNVVPEIKFSVLVYAAHPEDRFVLINGQRLGEGDSSQPGLVVEEIRREGVVFSYQLYKFLVER
jgi:hypothetical protein